MKTPDLKDPDVGTPALGPLLDEYLQLRRALGYKLAREESQLRGFVAFLKNKNAPRITSALALEFAAGGRERALATRKNYLCAIRGFARYASAMGFCAEEPPPGLLGRRPAPAPAHIYTGREVARLLALARKHPAAKNRARRHSLKPKTLYTLTGLLAATGMRLGEALKLKHEDIDWKEKTLRIGNAKFLKSRLVPVHPTTLEKLRAYARARKNFFAARARAATPWFFVTTQGNALTASQASREFRQLLQRAGLRKAGERRGPRLHDLRHRFATATLLRWYESGGEVGNALPVLATYLGHGRASATYWYLRNTPALMAAAKKRLEQHWKGAAHGR